MTIKRNILIKSQHNQVLVCLKNLKWKEQLKQKNNIHLNKLNINLISKELMMYLKNQGKNYYKDGLCSNSAASVILYLYFKDCNVPLMKSKKGERICFGCQKDYAKIEEENRMKKSNPVSQNNKIE